MFGIEKTPLRLIKSGKTSKEIWNKLCEHYESKSWARNIFIRRKFYHLEIKEGDDLLYCTVTNHINIYNELADQLCEAGVNMEEMNRVETLLCSLPKSFDG